MGLAGLTGVPGVSGIVPGVTAPVEPVEPTWLEFEVTTTAANQTYSWQIQTGSTISGTTEWGDGTSSTHDATGIFTKTYAAAGVYNVRLQVSFSASGRINLRPSADRVRVSRLISDLPNFPGVISLSSFLQGCSGIGSPPPPNFLRWIPSQTTLASFFRDCSGMLGDIPVDFLRWINPSANINAMFLGCTQLRVQPNLFGPNPETKFATGAPSFSSTFQLVGTAAGIPQGTAPEMWTWSYGSVPLTTNTFGNNSTSLTNWASIPAAWGGPA